MEFEAPATPDENTGPFELSLAAAQRAVDDWIRSTGKGYFAPLTNLTRLTEEVGELARIYARRHGELQPKSSDDVSPAALAEEMGDVLFVLLCLANQEGVRLDAALAGVIAKITERDLAAGRHDVRNAGGSQSEKKRS